MVDASRTELSRLKQTTPGMFAGTPHDPPSPAINLSNLPPMFDTSEKRVERFDTSRRPAGRRKKTRMNPFPFVGRYLLNILKAIGGQLKVKLIDYLKTFTKDHLGQLAVDAVQAIEAQMPNASGTEKRDAAVSRLKADLQSAGYDLKNFGLSTLNFAVESALQAILTGAVK